MLILFLRVSESIDDKYVQAARSKGIEATSIVLFTVEFVNRSLLVEALTSSFDSIICTSSNSIKALSQLEPESSIFDIPLFVVGPSTGAEARSVGFIHVLEADSANAVNLCEIVKSYYQDQQASILFLCGDKRLDTISDTLTSRFDLKEVNVYRTNPDHSQVSHLKTTIEAHAHDSTWLVFFSPSLVDLVNASEIFEKYPFVKCAAIGKTTAKRLEELGRSVDAIASSPTPVGLLEEIIRRCDRRC